MNRILLIGSGGAGKSTLAVKLGELIGVDVTHLDKLYWKPGWIKTERNEWVRTVEQFVTSEKWILDGNFGGTMDLRIKYCDTVIFLDIPRTICLIRVLKRRLKYRKVNRPDMTTGCNEKIDWEFVKWIWNFPILKKPELLKRLKLIEDERKVYWLKSPKEVRGFLEKVSSSYD